MKRHADGIFVQINIQADMDELWRLTQTPDVHQRWDLRFTDITYLPKIEPSEPQRFRYATRIGFGLKIEGEGETIGNRNGEDGQRTSALKFWSDDPKSLIREGSGYWKYTPINDGIQFETYYDYSVRFGLVGQLIDRFIFRPLLGWATAWSFDRLRLWLEKCLQPEVTLRTSLIHALARLSIAFVWLYHGLIPKLLFHHADEIRMLNEAGLSASVVDIVGWVEVALGLLTILTWRHRWAFILTAGLMVLATAGVVINSPAYLIAAFNPVTLNLQMIILAVIGYLSSQDLPSASRCRRKRGETT